MKDFNQKKQHMCQRFHPFSTVPKKKHTPTPPTPFGFVNILVFWPWILRMAATDFQRKLDEATKRKNGVSAYRMEVAPESMQLLRSLATWNPWGLGLWGDATTMDGHGVTCWIFFLIPKLVPPGKSSSTTFEVSCKQGAPKVAKEKLGIRDLNFDCIFLLNKCFKILTWDDMSGLRFFVRFLIHQMTMTCCFPMVFLATATFFAVRGMVMHGQSSAMLRLPCSSCYVVHMQQKPRRHCRLCPWSCRISRAIQHKRSTRSGRMAELLMGYRCAMACTHIMKFHTINYVPDSSCIFMFDIFPSIIYPLKLCVYGHTSYVPLFWTFGNSTIFAPATGGEHQQYPLPRDFRRFRSGSKSVEVGRLWATRCPGNFQKDHLLAEVVFHWKFWYMETWVLYRHIVFFLNICKVYHPRCSNWKITDLYFLRNQFLEPFWHLSESTLPNKLNDIVPG